MAAWTGWAADVLRAMGAPVTNATTTFLDTWHSYEGSACMNNPLNTTLHVMGSSTCNFAGVQSYMTQTMGTGATVQTLEGGNYPALVAALHSGDPFAYPNPSGVAENVKTWGTPSFAAWYLERAGSFAGTAVTPPPSPTTQDGTVRPADALGGYADLRNSLSRHLPRQTETSRHLGQQTLRMLGRKSRVKG